LTPLQPTEFGLVRVSYSKPINAAGTEVSFGGYFAASQPGGELDDLDYEGRSVEAEIGIRHPFLRSRSGSLWGGVDFRLRDASQRRDDVKVRDDRLAILAANAFGTRQFSGGRLRGRIALLQGLDLFDATQRGDVLASRRDASGVFTKVEAWGEAVKTFNRAWSLQLQAEGQVANGPLLSSEEMGLGGRSFGRAWDHREFGGDRGIAGSAELRFDIEQLSDPLRMIQLYGYADAGTVDNYGLGTGGGRLASAGGGFRLWLTNGLEAGVEVGVPLTDGADPSDGRDPRLSFTIGGRF
jgi:hemolysin activation/secretion protein